MKMTTKRLKTALAALAMLMAGGGAAHAGHVVITASLDSTGTMLMGKTKKWHVEVVHDRGTRGTLLMPDTLAPQVEIASLGKNDTVDLDNNRVQINRDILIQAFDSGAYQLPPMRLVVDGDTFASKPLTLHVTPVQVDMNGKLKPYKPVQSLDGSLLDYLPDHMVRYWLLYLLAALLVVGLLYAYLRWWRKGINPLKPEKKRLPPYEEAVAALQRLKDRQLWQNGQEKEYYSELTDILRVYIDRRFGINAVEMSSTEIKQTLRHNEQTKLASEQVDQLLTIADFVKFAKFSPLADENVLSLRHAQEFVELTKPEPQETAGDEKGKEGDA